MSDKNSRKDRSKIDSPGLGDRDSGSGIPYEHPDLAELYPIWMAEMPRQAQR